MKRTLTVLTYGALFASFVTGLVVADLDRAQAQARNDLGEFCAPADALFAQANKIFHETVKWTGKDINGYRYVLTESPDSWTFIMVDNKPGADGATPEACIKASDGMTAAEHKENHS